MQAHNRASLNPSWIVLSADLETCFSISFRTRYMSRSFRIFFNNISQSQDDGSIIGAKFDIERSPETHLRFCSC